VEERGYKESRSFGLAQGEMLVERCLKPWERSERVNAGVQAAQHLGKWTSQLTEPDGDQLHLRLALNLIFPCENLIQQGFHTNGDRIVSFLCGPVWGFP